MKNLVSSSNPDDLELGAQPPAYNDAVDTTEGTDEELHEDEGIISVSASCIIMTS